MRVSYCDPDESRGGRDAVIPNPFGGIWFMKDMRARPLLRLLTILAVASLALGAGACGSDDSGGDGGNGGSAQTGDSGSGDGATETPVAAGSPEAEVQAAYERFDKAMKAGDAKAACASFTAKGRKEFETFGDQDKTCEQRVASLSKKISKDIKPKIESVRVSGDTARMIQSAPNLGKALIIFRNESGVWKMHSTTGG